jgi:ribosomal protein S21
LRPEEKYCWTPVAHACNPSYSGGKDQEARSSKPPGANSLQGPISKKPITKIGLVEWLKVKTLSSSPSTAKKKKKKRKDKKKERKRQKDCVKAL